MNESSLACTGYTVQIKTYDPTAPKVYKCMQQAEYDSYMAQTYKQDHSGDGFAFALMLVFLLIISGLIVWFLIDINKGGK